jgi:pimeloyl-ACP methyl ester carboxylesterase
MSDADLAAARAQETFRDFRYVSRDGLRLCARDYGRDQDRVPVVCLPGLTRSARDFHALALYLANHRQSPRRVASFDYRGRGCSEWDPNPANYAIAVEMADVCDGMTALGIPRAVILGTSRGGIIGMAMAFTQAPLVAGLVLNDVGPFVEPKGLVRLKSYVGRTPAAASWADAVRIQRRLHGSFFPAFKEEDWEAFAWLTYSERDGQPVSDYDPRLAEALSGNVDEPGPNLWSEFRALRIPILAIRGANSDILSEATLQQMSIEPASETVTVPDEGHPPQLRPGPLFARIAAFLERVDQVEASGGAISRPAGS